MTVIPKDWVDRQEILSRIERLQEQYASDPDVKRIAYRIGVDWTDDPAVFIDVTVAHEVTPANLQKLSEKLHADLLRDVRSDEIGLHSYLKFMN